MTEKTPIERNAEKRRAESKAAFWLAVIAGGFVVLSVAGMLVFDAYGEKRAGNIYAPQDAADR